MRNSGTISSLLKDPRIRFFYGRFSRNCEERLEYEKARDDMKDEMTQWGKSEQARLDADPADQERIQKALEEARR